MLTVLVVLALLVGGVCAGEFVRGQCRRMLSRPHPSVSAAALAPSGPAVTADEALGV
jgi:hypothetical protein